jgi:transmembrane sensor
VSDEPTAPPHTLRAGPPDRLRRLWAPAACAGAIVLSLWGPNLLRPPPPASTAYASMKGQTRRIKLADASLLWMNGATLVHVVFEDRLRRATLEVGEAELTVVPNGRPFEISAGDRLMRTHAADVDLARYPRQGVLITVLTVRSGEVGVGQVGGRDPPRTLHAGEQMRWTDGQAASATRELDPNAAFSWQSRKLVYAQVPLSDVAADLDRYLDRPIAIAQPSVGRLLFSGTLPIDREDRILRRIEAALPVRALVRRDAVALTARGPASGPPRRPAQ